ncbi:MAG: hypothetical protein DHS20C11_16960 [Lysobacteraceae bacterium]|nr:MAG: hypothetical protein DHS20C11_16960 [Xanthomonadaceae bacterium]
MGSFSTLAANPHRRWASQDLLFALDAPVGTSFDVEIEPSSATSFNAGRWELHASYGDVIFGSGFQTE